MPCTYPSLPHFGLEVLSWCHIVAANKIEPKKVNYNHHNEDSLLNYTIVPCIVVGQDRVVVVVIVINAPFPSLSLKFRTNESKVQSSTIKMVVVCYCTLRIILKSLWPGYLGCLPMITSKALVGLVYSQCNPC